MLWLADICWKIQGSCKSFWKIPMRYISNMCYFPRVFNISVVKLCHEPLKEKPEELRLRWLYERRLEKMEIRKKGHCSAFEPYILRHLKWDLIPRCILITQKQCGTKGNVKLKEEHPSMWEILERDRIILSLWDVGRVRTMETSA